MTDFTADAEPRCKGKYSLFESVIGIDHRIARGMCLGDKADDIPPCPLLEACRRLAHDQDYHDGTWAGRLFVNGKPRTAKVKAA